MHFLKNNQDIQIQNNQIMSKFEFKPKLFLDLREYNKEKLTADIMAGLIVGIVALPLAIAFGIASGVCKSADRRVLLSSSSTASYNNTAKQACLWPPSWPACS